MSYVMNIEAMIMITQEHLIQSCFTATRFSNKDADIYNMSSSRGSSRPRERTCISVSPTLAGRLFKTGATWEALCDKHILWHDDCLLFKWEWIVREFLMLIVFTLRRLSTSRKWKSWPCDLRGDRGKELEEGQGGRRGSHTPCSVQFS